MLSAGRMIEFAASNRKRKLRDRLYCGFGVSYGYIYLSFCLYIIVGCIPSVTLLNVFE